MIKTVIVDPEKQEREKISALLSGKENIEVIAHGKDGYDALKLISSLKPDIAILDTQLEFIEGKDIPPLLKTKSPETAIVILALEISDSQIYTAAVNQVSGFIDKNTDLETLPSILKCIKEGHSFISPAFAARILHLFSELSQKEIDLSLLSPARPEPHRNSDVTILFGSEPGAGLSKTELRILAKSGEGFSCAEIAVNLGLAVGTVRNYLSSIMRKTGLRNRSQLVCYAVKSGIAMMNP